MRQTHRCAHLCTEHGSSLPSSAQHRRAAARQSLLRLLATMHGRHVCKIAAKLRSIAASPAQVGGALSAAVLKLCRTVISMRPRSLEPALTSKNTIGFDIVCREVMAGFSLSANGQTGTTSFASAAICFAQPKCARFSTVEVRVRSALLLPHFLELGVPQHFGRLHAPAPHLAVGHTASMDRAIAVRAERLDITTPEGRGKGRIKARAGALALSGASAGLQLSQASKCACDSGYVASAYVAAQASPGRLSVRAHFCVSGPPQLKKLQSSAL